MTFRVIKDNVSKINTNANHFDRFVNSIVNDVRSVIQRRFGNLSAKTAKGESLKRNSIVTQKAKGKNTPLVGRTGKGRVLVTKRKTLANYRVGTTQKYMEKVLKGGTIIASGKGLIIPVNEKASQLLRKYTKFSNRGKGVTRLILDGERDSRGKRIYFIPKGKNVMLRKFRSKNRRPELMFIFKKTIELPNRDVMYLDNNNLKSIKQAIISYLTPR